MDPMKDKDVIDQEQIQFEETERNVALNGFDISVDKISNIFLEYYDRKVNEELNSIAAEGGPEGLGDKLKTNLTTGLDMRNEDTIRNRIAEFGENKMETHKMPPISQFIFDSLEDGILRVLIVVSIAQIIVGVTPITEDPSKDWIEGASLLIAICIVSCVSVITNYSKEKEFIELNKSSENINKTLVIRNGREERIPDTELLVGDIYKVNYGDVIPADGIVIKSVHFTCDEAIIGEHLDIQSKLNFEGCKKALTAKIRPSPVVCAGTFVKEGSATIMVLAVGVNTRKGQIIEDVLNSQSGGSMTPVQSELSHIMEHMAFFGFFFAVATVIFMLSRLFVNLGDTVGTDEGEKSTFTEVMEILILTVAIIVVSVPEGMPLAIVLTLAFSMKKMLKDKNLIRRMHATETMAEVNYLITDKKAVMTKNDLVFNMVFNNNEQIMINDFNPLTNEYCKFFTESLVLTAQVDYDENFEVVNVRDRAKPFIPFFEKHNIGLTSYAGKYFANEEDFIRVPYDFDKRKAYTLIKHDELPTGYRLFVKSDEEVVLNHINFYHDYETNEIKEIDSINFFLDQMIAMERRGEVAKIIAYKDIDKEFFDQFLSRMNTPYFTQDRDLTLIGIAGLKDDLIPNLKDSIDDIKDEKINIILMTEDKKETALGVSNEIGLLNNEDGEECWIRGDTFYDQIGGLGCESCKLIIDNCQCPRSEKEAGIRGEDEVALRVEKIRDMQVFEDTVKEIKLIYDAKPIHKLALVLGLKEMEETVAITGEGTNDSHSLLLADVGFSMNEAGTEIAKDAADVIIMDDSFNSIVQSVKWGRNLVANTKKFAQFQLTVNFSATWLIFLGVAYGNQSPLRPLQILWLNLMMNTMGSLGLVTEPFEQKMKYLPPFSKTQGIVDRKMWKHILFQAIIASLVSFAIYVYGTEFIKEDDPEKIEHIKTIYACFGTVPGKMPDFENETYWILSGIEKDWDKAVLKKSNSEAVCGIYSEVNTLGQALHTYIHEYGSTAHLGMVFNTFVYYTIFNKVNARVIDDSFNIFANIQKNTFLLVVMAFELILQALVIHFTTTLFHCPVGGLTWQQWLICIGLALVTFPVAVLLKILPLDDFVHKAGIIGVKMWHLFTKFLGIVFCCRCFSKEKKEEQKEKAVTMKNKRTKLREMFKTKSIMQQNTILNRKNQNKLREEPAKAESKFFQMMRKNKNAYSVMGQSIMFGGSKTKKVSSKAFRKSASKVQQGRKSGFIERRNSQIAKVLSQTSEKNARNIERRMSEIQEQNKRRRGTDGELDLYKAQSAV